MPKTFSDPRLTHRYLTVFDRLAVLRARRPAVFDTLPPRLRTAVAVHRHIGGRLGGVELDDGSAANFEAFHRRSRDGEAKPFGIVMLYLASHLRMAKPEA